MATNPLIDIIAARAFVELAAAVRAAASRTIERWAPIARMALPTSDELTFTQLRDSLPGVLEQIAKALESDQSPPARYIGTLTAAHGAGRFHQNYSLGEVLQEFAILRTIFLQEVTASLGRPPTSDEISALNASIDISVRRSVIAFVEHQSQQLQASSEAHSKYLSFLSHDLRGGLNGVFLMIEVLKRELVKETRFAGTVEDLDAMRRTLMETVGTMDRFLHAERFRKGKVQLRPAPLSLRSLVSEVASQYAYQARDKKLELRIDVAGDCAVNSDRELLALILQNLLSNAVKYSKQGEINIGGKFEEGNCVVWVRDQGPGIAPEKLNDLFTAFTRGETHGQPGMGLGLSIALQAANYLGAKLWAESEAGKGTTFFVQIPKELPVKAAAKINPT